MADDGGVPELERIWSPNFCADEVRLFNLNDTDTREFLHELLRLYGVIHGPLCVLLCVFGFLSNFVHIIVLTRRSMRGSAVNAIMTVVAGCDMGTMLSYLIYITHFALSAPLQDQWFDLIPGNMFSRNKFTWSWMVFLQGHMFVSISLHSATLWLAVTMAFMRRMTLHAATLNSRWQNARLARRVSVVVFGVVMALTVPTLFMFTIRRYPSSWEPTAVGCVAENFPSNYTEDIYELEISGLAWNGHCRLFKANLWLTGLLFKVIPCFLLILLSSSLLYKLQSAERKRRKLLLSGGSGNETNKRITSDRTTAMLLAILSVFLATELPQGLLTVLSALYVSDIHNIVYYMAGDLLDLLSLVNSSVNFVLYCLMSSRYRHTFCLTVLPARFFRCVETHPNGNSANQFLTNTDFPSRIRNGDVLELPIGRRRSSPGVRLVRGSVDAANNRPLNSSRLF